MKTLLPAVLVLASCAEPLECGPYTYEAAGNCFGEPVVEVTPDDPTFEDTLAALPECRLAGSNGRLDLDGRCVDDICVGGSVDALVETYGAQTCAPGGGRALCRWAGVSVYVPDADRDGQPDPGSSVSYLDIMRADVSNDDGLGIGASMSCFVDRLPAPDVLTLSRRDDGSWAIRELNWARAGKIGGLSACRPVQPFGSVWRTRGWIFVPYCAVPSLSLFLNHSVTYYNYSDHHQPGTIGS